MNTNPNPTEAEADAVETLKTKIAAGVAKVQNDSRITQLVGIDELLALQPEINRHRDGATEAGRSPDAEIPRNILAFLKGSVIFDHINGVEIYRWPSAVKKIGVASSL